MKKILGAVAAAALALTAQVASAATTFSFSFSGTTTAGALSGSGTFGAELVDGSSTVYEIKTAEGALALGGVSRTIKDLGFLTDPVSGDETGNFITVDDAGASLLSLVLTFNNNSEFAAFALGDIAAGFLNQQEFEGTAQFDVAAVPEPSTWAMMLLGFGAVGVALRRRRMSVALAA
ncbi:PEPxxWA-CTERM sorting domain-containing protein [Sphingomonas sp. 1P08PE]|uniref:PEPxxWA-CTERM sorting domain-containing protein n=1 Tax=Sphingomonas sp. 1P08PE TaxID=554122 RepID=UPI0039A0051F